MRVRGTLVGGSCRSGCPCRVPLPRAPAACPCRVPLPRVPATCPCHSPEVVAPHMLSPCAVAERQKLLGFQIHYPLLDLQRAAHEQQRGARDE